MQIIRNRESAQRSRNQRKAHLAWLEVRVVELEKENKLLREGSAASPTAAASSSKTRPTAVATVSDASSPLLSVDTLDLVGTATRTGGINLAEVAPPPPGISAVDNLNPAQGSPSMVERLRAENAALRSRLSFLEGLVQQINQTVAGASAAPLSDLTAQLEPLPLEPQTELDWESIFKPAPVLENDSFANPILDPPSTFVLPDPPLPSHLSPTLYSFPSVSSSTIDSTQQSSSDLPLACHPAAVATRSVQTEWSLQRARTDSDLTLGMSAVAKRVEAGVTPERLDGVVRVLVALARIRGWIPSRSTPNLKVSPIWLGGRRRAQRRCDLRSMSGLKRRQGGTWG